MTFRVVCDGTQTPWLVLTGAVVFVRFDKSVDPEKLVHQICLDAQAKPDQKRSRYIQRLIPARSIRKTLSVDVEEFAREILKPHFHSGGPSKKVCCAYNLSGNLEVRLLTNALQPKYAIRPSLRSNKKFSRDVVIKTIADVVGPEHPVDLKNYDLIILVDIVQVRRLVLLTQPKKASSAAN